MAAKYETGFEQHRRPTWRDKFLDTMNRIVPWADLCAMIEPHYPKRGNGRPPIGFKRMLRIHFIQHWFNLADFACAEALYDITSLRHFAGINLGCEAVPDATTLLKFRRLLEKYTLIAAPSSIKNVEKKRNPEMHQTRKGQQWYCGMKLHIGVDSQSGLAHSAVVISDNVHDKHPPT